MNTGRPAKARVDGWGKDTLLRELRTGLSLREVCNRYALEASPGTLRREVTVWRLTDPLFDRDYTQIMADRGHLTRINHDGPEKREYADPNLADWRVRFCERLYLDASRLAAAEGSPYEYRQICKMLDCNHVQYDKDFADLVKDVELRMNAEAEGLFFNALREADTPKDKAWIASKWLERRDPSRWSKQVEMIHSGTVKHEHEHKGLPREQRIAELMAAQQEFFKQHAPALVLESGLRESIDVVEAELVAESSQAE